MHRDVCSGTSINVRLEFVSASKSESSSLKDSCCSRGTGGTLCLGIGWSITETKSSLWCRGSFKLCLVKELFKTANRFTVSYHFNQLDVGL